MAIKYRVLEKLGLQAKKLAELVGISPAYLNLIGGKRKLELLLKVCQELRIEISDLVDDSIINLNNSKVRFLRIYLKSQNLKIEKIKAFRRQLGIQANKLAEQTGISPSYLNLIWKKKY